MLRKFSYLFFGCSLILGSIPASAQKDGSGGDLGKSVILTDAQHPPALPNNSDLYTIKYKLKNPDALEHLARLVRSFTASSSRIFPVIDGGLLQVTDTANSLKRVYDLLKDNDAKPTVEMQKKWTALQKEADQKRAEKASK